MSLLNKTSCRGPDNRKSLSLRNIEKNRLNIHKGIEYDLTRRAAVLVINCFAFHLTTRRLGVGDIVDQSKCRSLID